MSKRQIGLTPDGTTEPASREQILRHERGQGNINSPYSADHEQDWQPSLVGPYSATVYIYIYIYIYIYVMTTYDHTVPGVFKKNLNASKPSEHPPQVEECLKVYIGGNIGCRDKTSSWYHKGSPM